MSNANILVWKTKSGLKWKSWLGLLVWIICRLPLSLSHLFHLLSVLLSRMSELPVRRDLGSTGTRQFLNSCLISHHRNMTASASKNSHYELVIAIPMPYQCHWEEVSVRSSFGLRSHGLGAAVCLLLLKLAVFTYSLFHDSQSFFGIYCQTMSLISFYDHNSKLLAILF